ncbi:hypothetical protein TIFTF001_025838 [Ficus carica]|uniref:Uncharacterized protein n=1 Tax=Ficus carica TaxID=3494 RepID=A0AA88DFV2_FICCA|nr:hypothetical protein TIFTF001_025838 [Ficus carica]
MASSTTHAASSILRRVHQGTHAAFPLSHAALRPYRCSTSRLSLSLFFGGLSILCNSLSLVFSSPSLSPLNLLIISLSLVSPFPLSPLCDVRINLSSLLSSSSPVAMEAVWNEQNRQSMFCMDLFLDNLLATIALSTPASARPQ